MAHELTTNEKGETEFFSAVTKGWHKLGQTSDRQLTAEEALKESRLDWTVEQVPVYHQAEGEMIEVPDQYCVRRTDNYKALSIMTKRYQVIQNHETFSFADDIIGSGRAVWDTAGSISGGRVVFMQVELPGRLFLKSNPDDQTVKKVLFVNSHDGSKALMGMITPVRVVCQNTLNAALGSKSNQFKVYHRKNFQSRKDEAAKVLGLASAFYDDLQIVMDTLAEQQVTHTYVEGFVSALMPTTKDEVSTRTENRRNQITNLFQNGKGNNGETKWDLFNAVTEYVDHHSVGRVTETRLDRSDALADIESEARFERAILGSGATLKQKALTLLS
jgi:phage/plasmid-like protein (TIGR03299 family)